MYGLADRVKDLEIREYELEQRAESLESELDFAREVIREQGEFIQSLKQEIANFLGRS